MIYEALITTARQLPFDKWKQIATVKCKSVTPHMQLEMVEMIATIHGIDPAGMSYQQLLKRVHAAINRQLINENGHSQFIHKGFIFIINVN